MGSVENRIEGQYLGVTYIICSTICTITTITTWLLVDN